MKRGSSGQEVRDLQARLKQIGWFEGRVSGTYGSVTTKSVKGFQAKRKIPATGEVDQRTLDRLRAATRSPGTAELDPSIRVLQRWPGGPLLSRLRRTRLPRRLLRLRQRARPVRHSVALRAGSDRRQGHRLPLMTGLAGHLQPARPNAWLGLLTLTLRQPCTMQV